MSENKAKKLMNMMSKAYDDTEVNKYPDLMDLLLKCATELNNEESYSKVATKLGRGISDHYMKNKKTIPAVMLDIYKFIQSEVKSGHINNAELRQRELGYGLASIPVIFGNLSN